nr:two-component response regulator ARR12-like [Tanacetum cinerariifolium]
TCVYQSGAALRLLSENSSKFDLLLVDCSIHDADVHAFLRETKNMDVLSIVNGNAKYNNLLMSEQDDDGFIINAFKSGAFLVMKKPLTMEAVSHIRQDVIRERIRKRETHRNKNRNLKVESQEIGTQENVNLGSNRKHRGESSEQATSSNYKSNLVFHWSDDDSVRTMKKKTCVEWTPELHAKFINAVIQLGEGSKSSADNIRSRCYPKNILDLMAVPGLTRMQVASHLQLVSYSLQLWLESLLVGHYVEMLNLSIDWSLEFLCLNCCKYQNFQFYFFWEQIVHEFVFFSSLGHFVSLGIVAGEGIPVEHSPANISQRQVARERFPQRLVAGESPEMSLRNVVNVAVTYINPVFVDGFIDPNKCRKEKWKNDEKLSSDFTSKRAIGRKFGCMPSIQINQHDQDESSIGFNLSMKGWHQKEMNHMTNQTERGPMMTRLNQRNIEQCAGYTPFSFQNSYGSKQDEGFDRILTETIRDYIQPDAGEGVNHHTFSPDTSDDFPDFLRDLDGNGPNDNLIAENIAQDRSYGTPDDEEMSDKYM